MSDDCENAEAILLNVDHGVATYMCNGCGDVWEQLA